jgi:hypothetical protein
MKKQHANEIAVDSYDEADSETIDLQEIGASVRQLVQSLYGQGADPEDISYAFAYVAAEFGLWYTNNSFRVFPIVLKGMTDASRQKIREENEEKTNFSDGNVEPVVREIIH